MSRSIFRRFWKREDGNATVEFAILFPFYIGLVLASIEGGWLMTRHMLVERGVDVAMRDVRLGNLVNPTYDDFRDRICSTVAFIPNCTQNLVLSTQILQLNDTVSPDPAPCFDRNATPSELANFNPADGHDLGSSSQIVVIKICAIVDPILGTFGLAGLLPTDDSNGFPIRTQVAFLHEPA